MSDSTDKETVLAAYHDLWQRLENLPSVTAAGAVTSLPLSQMFAWGPVTVEGRVSPPDEKFINADIRVVSGHYFRAMEIPLREGRLFTEDDVANKPHVAVVDDYMAQQLWPNQDPIGKRLHFGSISETDSPWITVVGVVGRVKQYTLDADSRIALYVPQMQYMTRAMNVVMRSSDDPTALAGAVKQQIHELNPDLPLYNVTTMQERFDKSLARRRFTMLVLGTFAAISLGLAMIGIYGLIAYLVGQGHPRSRHSAGPRRDTCEYQSADRSRRDDPGLLGGRDRHWRCTGSQPLDALAAFRCRSHRCRDVCRGSHSTNFCRFSSQLCPSATRFPHRSQHIVTMRIGATLLTELPS